MRPTPVLNSSIPSVRVIRSRRKVLRHDVGDQIAIDMQQCRTDRRTDCVAWVDRCALGYNPRRAWS